jgi:hypothetical protein
MTNRKDEIENIVPGFTASIMNLISHYRQKRDALNQVPHFIEAVERERERMTAKFNALLSNQDYADLAHDIHAAQQQVYQICDGEIARASASQTVEFDTLTSALRDTGRSLDNAVQRIEQGRK